MALIIFELGELIDFLVIKVVYLMQKLTDVHVVELWTLLNSLGRIMRATGWL